MLITILFITAEINAFNEKNISQKNFIEDYNILKGTY